MFVKLGTVIGYLADTPARTWSAASVCILLFSFLQFGIHIGLLRLGTPSLVDAAIDALLVGCLVGFAIWLMLVAVRHRRVQVRNELEKIADLNHEIRNALQVIAHSQFDIEPARRQMILESVDRISSVLKRIFPANV